MLGPPRRYQQGVATPYHCHQAPVVTHIVISSGQRESNLVPLTCINITVAVWVAFGATVINSGVLGVDILKVPPYICAIPGFERGERLRVRGAGEVKLAICLLLSL